MLNGRPATRGESAELGKDTVVVDGKPLRALPKRVYLALNKPAGYVTTRSDPHAERTIMELIRTCPGNVFPVGRLDKDTTGLLLLTNDGDLAYRLTHPRFGVEKTYRARVKGRVQGASAEKLRRGVLLEDGLTAPARIRLGSAKTEHGVGEVSTLELTIHEGRKRQVRRMLEAVEHPILHLERIRYGPLELGSLRPGQWRRLTQDEVLALERSTAEDPKRSGHKRT